MPCPDQPCTDEQTICRTVSEPARVGVTPETQPCSLDVPELRRILRQRQKTSPILRPHLANLEQQLKSWADGGNRPVLRGHIRNTIRSIEALMA